MTCTEMPRTQAFLDGELHGDDAADAERHIASCAECQAQSADTAQLSDLLRSEATHHKAPELLRTRIRAKLAAEPQSASRRGFWRGAFSGAGASLLAASLAFFALMPPSADTIAQTVVDAHTGAMMRGKTIAIASSSHHTVKPWFAGRIALSPPVGDFAAQGFPLAGGRLDEVAGTTAAVVVYRHGAHTIDLFVWADRGAKLPADTLVRGYRSTFWKKGDLDFAAVSDTDAAELKKFVALVRKQN